MGSPSTREALSRQKALSEWEASSTQEALSEQKALSEWGPPLHKRPYLGRRPFWMGGFLYTRGPIWADGLSGWGPPLHKRPYLGRRTSVNGAKVNDSVQFSYVSNYDRA